MSEASLKWYHELKQDPERYAAYRVKRRAYRKANPSAKGSDGTHERKTRKRVVRLDYIREHLRNNPCVCGESDIDCLQFHHRDPTVKERPVSQMVNYSYEKINAEIEKCVVLCANCHCKEHARLRRGESSLL